MIQVTNSPKLTNNWKIIIAVVLIFVAILIINRVSNGKLPFYILGGVGFIAVIIAVFAFANKETVSQVTQTTIKA